MLTLLLLPWKIFRLSFVDYSYYKISRKNSCNLFNLKSAIRPNVIIVNRYHCHSLQTQNIWHNHDYIGQRCKSLTILLYNVSLSMYTWQCVAVDMVDFHFIRELMLKWDFSLSMIVFRFSPRHISITGSAFEACNFTFIYIVNCNAAIELSNMNSVHD